MLKLSISEANAMFSREQIRGVMPKVSAIYDEINAKFPGSKVVYACEGGLEIGERFRSEFVRSPQPTINPPIETTFEKAVRLKQQMLSRRKA